MANFAFQTIACGPVIRDFKKLAECCKASGITGIELAQPLRSIYKSTKSNLPVTLSELFDILTKNNLELIGIAGGDISDRMLMLEEICRYVPGIALPYVYVDSEPTFEQLERMRALGGIFAVHPHIHKQIGSLKDGQNLVRKLRGSDVNAFVLVDTAHVMLMGQSPSELTGQPWVLDTLAIHLKNWRFGFGSSFHQYALGFTSPSRGDIDLKTIAVSLQNNGYRGWVVIEVDFDRDTWYGALADAVVYFDLEYDEVQMEKTRPRQVGKHRGQDIQAILASDHLHDYSSFLDLACAYLAGRVGSGSFLLVSPNEGVYQCDYRDQPLFSVERRVNLDGTTVRPETIQWLIPRMRTTRPTKLSVEGAVYPHLVLFPILSSRNINQTNYLLAMFLDSEVQDTLLEELVLDAFELSKILDNKFMDKCRVLSGFVPNAASTSDSLIEFVTRLGNHLMRMLKLDGYAFYFVTDNYSQVSLACSGGDSGWPPTLSRTELRNPLANSIFDVMEKGVTCAARFSPVPDNTSHFTVHGFRQSIDLLQSHYAQFPTIFLVLSSSGSDSITRDSIVLVDEFLGYATSYLVSFQARDYASRSLKYAIHDIKFPLSNGLNALDLLESELTRQGVSLRHSYISEIESYLLLAQTILRNMSTFGDPNWLPKCSFEVITNFESRIIAPAVRQFSHEVRKSERRDASSFVSYQGFANVPPALVDPLLLQQLLFNLLSNAYKYKLPGSMLSISIKCFQENRFLNIDVEDNGLGVPTEYEEQIFEREKRGPVEQQKRIEGMGIGLWVGRRIAQAHKGSLELAEPSHSFVTNFRLRLPILG